MATTVEKLFVQIFDRKKRIIEQVKNQTEQFDEHLASKCLIDGIVPPSWLFSPSFPSFSSNPNEFKKEDLISELLLPRSHYSLYQKYIVPAYNKELPIASVTDVGASNNDINAGDRLSVLPPFPNDNIAVNGFAELDASITSPPDCAGARVLDDDVDHAQSLIKIQRSKCRQRALRLRNSAEASKSRLCDEYKNKNGGGYTSEGIGCGISYLQYDQVVDESELVKVVDINNRSCGEEEEEAEMGECGGKEKNSDICNGRTVGSGCSVQQDGFLNEPRNNSDSSYIAKEDGSKCVEDLTKQSCKLNEISELADHSILPNENCIAEEANVVDCKGGEANSIVCFDRITSSRSSISQTSMVKETMEVGNSSCLPEGHEEILDKSSEKQPISVGGLLELVKSSPDVSNGSYGSRKSKTKDKEIKEKGSKTYVGRITSSRSSSYSQQPSYVNKCLGHDNSCGDSTGLKQLSNHVYDLTELVKPLDIADESTGVEEVRECQNIHAGSDAYCDRITSSSVEKLNNVNEFLNLDNSSDIVKDGDVILAQSFGRSSQPPQPSILVRGAEFNDQVLPCTEGIIPETDTDGNGLVDSCSIADVSNPGDAGYGVEVFESRLHNECAMHVNPKQLDFSDVEDNRLLEACDPALQNKQEDADKRLSPSLHCTDVLEKVTSVSYYEKLKQSIEKPLLEEQEFSRESCEGLSEGHMNSSSILISVQQKMEWFISQNQEADSYFMGSWPQHKRIKLGDQAANAFSASPSLKIKSYQSRHVYHKGDSVQSDVVKSPAEDRSVEHQTVEKPELSSSKPQVDEVEIILEGMDRSARSSFSLMLEEGVPAVSNSKSLAVGVSQGCLSEKAEVTDPASTVFDVVEHDNAEENQVTGEHTAEENHVLFQVENGLELEDAELLNYTEDAMPENKYYLERKGNLSYCSSGSPPSQYVIDTIQTMPEFEGFVMETDDAHPCTANEKMNLENLDLPPTELGRASALERLCKSTCLRTPSSRFSATYGLHEALNMYQSIPNGLLEGIELRSQLNMNGDGSEQLGANYSFLDEGVNHALGRSNSISFPLSNAQSAWDITKPCVSPVGKFWDGIPLKSGSSGKRVSSIPELPCISEENETTDGVPDRLMEGIDPELVINSAKRESLADITKIPISLTSVCEAEMQGDRGSLASMNTEVSVSGTCERAKMKLGKKNSNKRRFTSKDKENHNISLGGDGFKRGNGSLHSRFSRPKLSGKVGPRGPSLQEKESKPNNIVSNITSFIPLVQQKQAAAVITGKRDIKVKALEAAEAAKRNAEMKENERKMRKEAMKLERAKMEEQNLRQLELEKKKKEEEKKKKEADMAAKKRQREEEERKEKERKKMRVEEAKRNQLAQEKKLHIEKTEKEVKFQAPEDKAHERKESKARFGKQEKIEKAKGDNSLWKVPPTEPTATKVSTNDNTNVSVIPENCKGSSDCGDNLKVMDSIRKASESDSLISNITQEQSYEISPYKGSDDEDEDEDEDVRNSKFVPLWASKSQLALVSSQQRIDPESVFPPESFCSISEVLLPRRLQQK